MTFVEELVRFGALSLTGKVWIVLTTTFTACAVYLIVKFVMQCIKLKDFSGPLALPLLGNCYQTEALFLFRFLSKLRRRFGKVFTFFAFTKPYLVVCDPAIVRRVLSDTKTFEKGSDYTNVFSVGFGEGLVTSTGEKHRKDRTTFGKLFVKTNIVKHLALVNDLTEQAISQFLNGENRMCDPLAGKHGVNDGKNGSKVYNIERFFSLLTVRVFMQFALHYNYPVEKELWFSTEVSKGSLEVGRMITLNLPVWDIFPAVKNIREGRKVLWSEMKKVVDARRESMAAGGSQDIEDCVTVMIQENFSEQDIDDHLVTLLSAGNDTTSYFSSYLCYLLATNPEAQDRLRQEILSVMKGRTEVTADDITEMGFLANVMKETLRLYSIIPCVTRTCTQETHIKEANVVIPEGVNVMIPMFLINRDPDLWKNPSAFEPDRFEGSSAYFTSSKDGYFPFGYGARACIGMTLAQLESAVFICKLLMKFKLKEDDGFKPIIFAGISLTTSNGINVKLEKLA